MIIADSGFFVALLNYEDANHSPALETLKSLRESLITTWPVLTETTHILLRRTSIFNVVKFTSEVMRGSCEIYEIPKLQQHRIAKLMLKYRELPMDLADASLILLAEHLGHGRILTTDKRDFRTYRWKERKPFENLMK